MLGGAEYRLTVRWCGAEEGGWLLDIADGEGATTLVCGVALVTGTDMLAPYPDIGFGGMMWLYAVDEQPPGYDGLGTRVQLILEMEAETWAGTS